MEDNKQVHQYYDFTPLAAVAVLVLALFGTGLWLFFKAVEAGNQTAIAIIFVLWSLIMFGAGVATSIKITDHTYRHERERESQQQAAFVANAKENIGLLLGVSQVQRVQAQTSAAHAKDAWQQAQNATRLLAAGGNNGDVVDAAGTFEFMDDFTDLD
jgi:type II secretory pathway component PulK